MAVGVGELLIQQPELAERLLRALDMKGDLPNLLRATVDQSIQVDDMTLFEYEWLRRGYRQSVSAVPAVNAANFCGVVLGSLSPQDSILCAIRRIRLYNFAAAAQNFRWAVLSSATWAGFTLANSFPAVHDSRSLIAAATIPNSQMKVFSGNLAANPVASGALIGLPAGGVADLDLPVTLTDSSEFSTTASPAFMLFADAINVGFHLTIEYYERPLLTSERK